MRLKICAYLYVTKDEYHMHNYTYDVFCPKIMGLHNCYSSYN